jgi:hypothetical protein
MQHNTIFDNPKVSEAAYYSPTAGRLAVLDPQSITIDLPIASGSFYEQKAAGLEFSPHHHTLPKNGLDIVLSMHVKRGPSPLHILEPAVFYQNISSEIPSPNR